MLLLAALHLLLEAATWSKLDLGIELAAIMEFVEQVARNFSFAIPSLLRVLLQAEKR